MTWNWILYSLHSISNTEMILIISITRLRRRQQVTSKQDKEDTGNFNSYYLYGIDKVSEQDIVTIKPLER